jgi:hypothetical protein
MASHATTSNAAPLVRRTSSDSFPAGVGSSNPNWPATGPAFVAIPPISHVLARFGTISARNRTIAVRFFTIRSRKRAISVRN